MELVLFRHGIAEDARPGQGDAERALTAQGRERTLRAAQGLARVVDRPGVLLASPKVRAHQTACLLGEVFDLSVETCEPLAGHDLVAIERVLRRRPEDSVALIGHEPTLGYLAAALLGITGGEGEIEVKKATAVVIEAPFHEADHAMPATLKMLLPPRVLRCLADTA